MCRQCLFGGLRIGMYDPVKQFYVGKDHVGDVPLLTKIAAGLTTGALAICIASPTDLVKVRMQAEGKLPAGTPKKYPTAMGAYTTIARCASCLAHALPKQHVKEGPCGGRTCQTRGIYMYIHIYLSLIHISEPTRPY